MARYFSTSLPPRSELIPDQDEEDVSFAALLDERERRNLQSYRPPSGIDPYGDSIPTVRWSREELDALLEVARATVEPTSTTERATNASTLPPPPGLQRRTAVRRSEVVMTDVRARQRGSGNG